MAVRPSVAISPLASTMQEGGVDGVLTVHDHKPIVVIPCTLRGVAAVAHAASFHDRPTPVFKERHRVYGYKRFPIMFNGRDSGNNRNEEYGPYQDEGAAPPRRRLRPFPPRHKLDLTGGAAAPRCPPGNSVSPSGKYIAGASWSVK
ncbi:hypothetical protein E2C01_058465 [Portunus trituberculatus]|uniref:Uncharacterized protein n=1 Tax=Portunus trituberculatus TaxID=210409 RepID=A0A5B7GVM7_PORTR|nr:hypothetical protein [Portunus trituberculatus]